MPTLNIITNGKNSDVFCEIEFHEIRDATIWNVCGKTLTTQTSWSL